MACGGKVKKYETGGAVRDSSRWSDDYSAKSIPASFAKTPIGKRAHQNALESNWDDKKISNLDISNTALAARDEADAEAQRESTRGIRPENRKKGGHITKKVGTVKKK